MSGKSFTKKQKAAVLTDGGALVSAAAGSGKTSVLTARIVRLILEGKADIGDMMIATFTNTAAAEMKSRISKQLYAAAEDRRIAEQAELTSIARIGTYHNFCTHILRENFDIAGLSCNFKVMQDDWAAAVKKNAAEKVLVDFIEEGSEDMRRCMERYSVRCEKSIIASIIIKLYNFTRVLPDPGAWLEKAAGMSFDEYLDIAGDTDTARKEYAHTMPDVKFIVKLVHAFEDEYTSLKESMSAVDFDDLLHRAYAVLKVRPVKYKYVFVDEYQDTNPLQEAIISLISDKNSLFMVGDIKQSIYRFNYADPRIFLDKLKKYENDGLFVMNENFRSSKAVVDAVNHVMGNVMSPEVGDVEYTEDESLIVKSDKKGTAEILLNLSGGKAEERYRSEAFMIADRIKELVFSENSGFGFGDIAVLIRSRGTLHKCLKDAFDSRGIPFSVDTDGAVPSECAEMLMQMLKAVDEQNSDIPVLSVMKYPYPGFTDAELAAIRLFDDSGTFAGAAKKYAEKKADRLSAKLKDFFEMLEKLSLYSRAYDIRSFIFHLIESFELFDYSEIRGSSEKDALFDAVSRILDSGERTLTMIIKHMDDYKKAHGHYAALSKEHSPDAVRIMSMHKSKGLGIPVVFAAGLDARFNFRDMQGHTVVMTDTRFGIMPMYIDAVNHVKHTTKMRDAAACVIRKESVSEELRLLYVAMTRAENSLYLCGSPANFAKREKLWEELSSGKIPYSEVSSMLDFVMGANTENGFLPVFTVDGYAETVAEKAVSSADISDIPKSEGLSDDGFISFEPRPFVPAKISVSALKKARQTKMFVPSLFDSDEHLSGAEFGSLVHSIMERAVNGDAAAVAASMYENLIITEEEYAAAIEFVPCIESFFASRLYSRIKSSKKVIRETPFNLLMPSEALGMAKGEIMVQGVIDLAFIEDDEWVLVDYKTDRVNDNNIGQLKKAYATQLSLYAQALRTISGIPVKERLLCFLRAGITENV